MMELALPRSWKEEFALAAAIRREDILYNEKLHRFETRERERQEENERAEEAREQESLETWEAALAPAEEVSEYRVEMDQYDSKTVEALMDNEDARKLAGEQIDEMLGRAEVLPDGRRVFKTIDGQKVFDEHGLELSAETIDPESIDDKKPRWEALKAIKDERVRLEVERQQLIDYQAKLDDARGQLDKGMITNMELKEMKAELSTSMPEAVRKRLGLDQPETAFTSKPDAALSSSPNSLEQLMRQTGFGSPGLSQ